MGLSPAPGQIYKVKVCRCRPLLFGLVSVHYDCVWNLDRNLPYFTCVGSTLEIIQYHSPHKQKIK